MKVSVKTARPGESRAEGLVIGAFEGALEDGDFGSINKSLGGRLADMAKRRKFEGKEGQLLAFESLGALPAGFVVAVGLGKKEEASQEKIRFASGKAARAVKASGVKSMACSLARVAIPNVMAAQVAQAIVEGACLALYSFTQFKKDSDPLRLEEIIVLAREEEQEEAAQMAAGAEKGRLAAEAVAFARDMINMPGNYATPSYLGAQAQAMGKKYGFKCVAHGPAAIKKMKMGGLMGVAKGSSEEPRFIVMEWLKGPKGQKPIVMVGKGLTFDSGGISIKPSLNMHEMKSDMSGAAATIAVMRAAAALKLKVNLVGLVPTAENMPSGSANKPGDVLTGLSGVTMEVLNTDAEGRLVLSDALAYAAKYNPDCMVDFATLTGACMVALGAHCSGLFGNDDELIAQLNEAGKRTGERLWPLPLFKEYEDDIKSDVADIANIGPRGGGASTAAAFLKKHVKGKWAHVDIAGTAFADKEKGYIQKGGVGVGVRLMLDFIARRAGLE
ncbi:MAG: leucyl aminopeptidase [Nitrospinota bacterium]|nr:leucyl aminopeptidase [Nitrospinota bacterium]